MIIHAHHPGVRGNAQETIILDNNINVRDELSININYKYLLDAISTVYSNELQILVYTSTNPIFIQCLKKHRE